MDFCGDENGTQFAESPTTTCTSVLFRIAPQGSRQGPRAHEKECRVASHATQAGDIAYQYQTMVSPTGNCKRKVSRTCKLVAS